MKKQQRRGAIEKKAICGAPTNLTLSRSAVCKQRSQVCDTWRRTACTRGRKWPRHGAEFVKHEGPTVPAGALLAKEHRRAEAETDKQRHKRPYWQKEQQRREGKGQIQEAFSATPVKLAGQKQATVLTHLRLATTRPGKP